MLYSLLTPVWGSLLIFIFCPLLGGLPLIDWIAYGLMGRKLSQVGTGNVSVSAAFYHGGTLVGILAVLSEASKGIIAVLLARAFFSTQPMWELLALMALVMGRYWMGKGAGTTNVFWGMLVHDWQAALLTALIGGVSFTIVRDRAAGRLLILILLASMLSLRHPNDSAYIGIAWSLSALLWWILQKIPDDLDLPETGTNPESRRMFRFFRGDKAILTLDRRLKAKKVGNKAATLAYLKRLGYSVPNGWILLPGDDPQPLLDYLRPSAIQPLAVRSSALGEDSETASAAGQYASILNITTAEGLKNAILDCLASYDTSHAVQYRRDNQQSDEGMAVLIQQQIRGAFSGVAFSRDPVNPFSEAVIVEALPGEANRVVSGKNTPERYQIENSVEANGRSPLPISGDVPPYLIETVARLARELESVFHGIPQDIEWTYDGQQLWLLQARSITTLQPIWTRKIAAEVIPGVIRPLTWSINRPLTCGVWGEIFSLVLGKRANGLDFTETATLQYQHAYFNATLLGEIFRRMGLPSESLEFLTRGEKFSKPPLLSTLRNLPGLLRLFNRERKLPTDFARDNRQYFQPILAELSGKTLANLPTEDLLQRIETILLVLKQSTYYSILAPLSFALRQAIGKVSLEQLDNRQTPEIASLQSLQNLASEGRLLLGKAKITVNNREELFFFLSASPDGQLLLQGFDRLLEEYGYLSDAATDIAVPRWQDNPESVRELFAQCLLNNTINEKLTFKAKNSWKIRQVQQRLNLKGQATTVYSQLLAHLRWSFLAIEQRWLNSGVLNEAGDIFFLTYDEIQQLITSTNTPLQQNLTQLIQQRRREYEQNRALSSVPFIIYGYPSAHAIAFTASSLPVKQQLQGIGASPGQVEGTVKILKNLSFTAEINKNTILVVPYTDSGWGPLLARASGIIAEVGGSLSHGAIVAREYGIPAVMDVHHATELLYDGQRVRIDGQRGIVEIL